jgi:hypothetical protein
LQTAGWAGAPARHAPAVSSSKAKNPSLTISLSRHLVYFNQLPKVSGFDRTQNPGFENYTTRQTITHTPKWLTPSSLTNMVAGCAASRDSPLSALAKPMRSALFAPWHGQWHTEVLMEKDITGMRR